MRYYIILYYSILVYYPGRINLSWYHIPRPSAARSAFGASDGAVRGGRTMVCSTVVTASMFYS